MSYFENMVANPNQFKLDLVYNAREILLEAAQEQRYSMKWFEESQENNEDEMLWQMSREHDEIARGLLKAYKIITGREVLNFSSDIEREIRWIEDTFELFER